MINRVILTGRLTSDIELRRTNDGTPFTFFTIAVNRRNTDNTDFISCVAWRKTADLMSQYLKKGALIGVEGKLEVFVKQENENKKYSTNVNVSTITFLESKTQANNRPTEQQIDTASTNEKPISFSGENNFNQSETTPVNNESFGKAKEVNASDINLEEIKF